MVLEKFKNGRVKPPVTELYSGVAQGDFSFWIRHLRPKMSYGIRQFAVAELLRQIGHRGFCRYGIEPLTRFLVAFEFVKQWDKVSTSQRKKVVLDYLPLVEGRGLRRIAQDYSKLAPFEECAAALIVATAETDASLQKALLLDLKFRRSIGYWLMRTMDCERADKFKELLRELWDDVRILSVLIRATKQRNRRISTNTDESGE